MIFRRTLLGLILALVGAAVLIPIRVAAQTEDPFSIRVESNLVLIHTEVYDTKEMNNVTQAYRDCRVTDRARFDSQPFSEPFIASDCLGYMVIHGLTAKDFHVFEDGVEQKVESVEYEPWALHASRDNLGLHGEWSQTPQAKWSTIDVGISWAPAPLNHFYRVGFVPTDPQPGKCRKIKVTVGHPHAAVYANDHYCYLSNPESDPLRGTKLGTRMESDLNSNKGPRIPLSVRTSFFYTNSQTARVDIVLGFPWDQLQHQFMRGDLAATIGVLGVAYKKDHTIATRFSDFACCVSGTRWLAGPISIAGNLPSHYETQIDLDAGAEYELRVVLSDGTNFGRAVIPIAIDSYDGNQLAISSVGLCNRFRDAKVAAEEAAAVNLAPQYVPLVSNGLQFTPADQSTFKSKDRLTAYFEVYEPVSGESNADVKAHVRIVDVKTGETKFQFHPVEARSHERPGGRTLPFAGDLPLAQLPRGDYRVDAQATDSAGHSTAVRSARFTIE